MIRLAFSTNAFKKNSVFEAIDAIAGIGYAGVEIMADVPHVYPPAFDESGRQKLREHVARAGLAISNINAFTLFAAGDTYHPTWIEDDAAKRAARIAHTLACIELAKQIGSKTISLQPGGPMIGGVLSREQAAERFASGLNEVLPAATRADVILAIEPEPGLFIETAAEYIEFKSRFFANERHVAMNCDIGHLFCVGDDPAAVIRECAADIAHVHVEDIGANRVHQHLTPGKGVINFSEIFSALRDIHYAGWTTVELYPYETTAAGVARLAFEHLQPIIRSLD